MSELQSLSSHISEWRSQQLNSISKQIQQNLRSIQSPHKEKCKKMKKIHCDTSHEGFGGQMELLMICLFNGYRAKTLVVIKQFLGSYLESSKKRWDEFISPISETCQPNHLLKYEINQNDSSIGGDLEGMSQLTFLLILNKLI
jgi:hypothetical protein